MNSSHASKVGSAPSPSLPLGEAEWWGGPTRAKPERGRGCFPEALRRRESAMSMAALAQPPRRSRRHLASPSHPPPLPLPATRLRRAGGGRRPFRKGLLVGEKMTAPLLVLERLRKVSSRDASRSGSSLPAGLRHSHIERRRRAPPPSPRSRSEWRGGPTRAKPERGGGCFPEALGRRESAVSLAALAQPPRRSRRHLTSPSHPPPLPLPATRLRRAGGGRRSFAEVSSWGRR